MPSSVNVPSSTSSAIRSRAVSFPASCWRAIFSSPPPSRARARRSCRSSASVRRRLAVGWSSALTSGRRGGRAPTLPHRPCRSAAIQPASRSATNAGWLRCGACPMPSISTIARRPAPPRAAARRARPGMIRSAVPHTTSTGIRATQSSRSSASTFWPCPSITARTVLRNAPRRPESPSRSSVRTTSSVDARRAPQPRGGERRRQPAPGGDRRPRAERAHHRAGAGERRRPQHRADVGARARRWRSAPAARPAPGSGRRRSSRCRRRASARRPSRARGRARRAGRAACPACPPSE